MSPRPNWCFSPALRAALGRGAQVVAALRAEVFASPPPRPQQLPAAKGGEDRESEQGGPVWETDDEDAVCRTSHMNVLEGGVLAIVFPPGRLRIGSSG
jgi:hypothetical protein